jgi:hypothetical protein
MQRFYILYYFIPNASKNNIFLSGFALPVIKGVIVRATDRFIIAVTQYKLVARAYDLAVCVKS